MGMQGSSSGVDDETLAVFSEVEAPGAPLTTSEVAERLGCVRRTAYGKLKELADDGELETKKVGARARVWWLPPERPQVIQTSAQSAVEQAQFHELAEAVTDYAIFVLDSDGIVQTWNEGAKQIKGYDEDEIVGDHFSTFYMDEDRENGRPARNLEEAAEEGRITDEGRRVRKDGSAFWANVTITALRDDDGELQGFVKITQDMTERHEYEEQLRTEKERFETLVREVKDYAIFLLDSDGVVQTWNEGAKQLKGYDEDEIAGEHFSAFYTEEDREAGRPENNLQVAAQEGRVEDEGERVRKDGETFWANVTITALYGDNGDVRAYAKVTRDMSERHKYEERLRAQRDELDELNQINAVIRDIDQSLVTATTRDDIEQSVCNRLAGPDAYSAAWIAEYTDTYEEMTPRAWAGVSEDYLEAIRNADADSSVETERGLGAEALQTQTIRPIQELQRDEDGEPWRDSSLAEGYKSTIAVPLVYNNVEYGVLMVYADQESAFDQRKISVMSELGETISHAIAAIRRKERERTLTTLQESTRKLLHTDTREGISDIIIETLTKDLALSDAVVYDFDTAENTLTPISSSFHAESYTNQLTPLSAGEDSPIWTSFVEGDTQLAESVIPSREVGARRTMVIPLGNYGVLTVAAAGDATFDKNRQNLVELVAATAEAALDRVESHANLRERDQLLQEQNQGLQRLNQINTIIREVDQGLVQATTHEEIQRIVCDRLTQSDRFRFAWIGVPDDIDEGLTPQARSGDSRGYLDSINLETASEVSEPEPAVTAFQTDAVAVVSNVAENLRSSQWRKEAFSREFQSIISVPLNYGDVTYGVLTAYADRPDVFDEMEQSVFTELSETIANAINAVETQQALLGDEIVNLKFQIQDDSTNFLARIARQVGSEITFEGMIPLSEDESRLFFVTHGASEEEIQNVLSDSVTVISHEVIAARDGGNLIEAVVSGPTITQSLIKHGASLQTLTVTEDGIQVEVDLPSSTDVRSFIEQFQAKYEGAEFLARSQREHPIQTRKGFNAELEGSLTDRQLEVLKTAYYSGFFASPRQSTGGDIADLLDVSQPTVTEQLRAAQCKILDLLLSENNVST